MVCRWFERQTEFWIGSLHLGPPAFTVLIYTMGRKKALLTGLISGFTCLIIYLSYALAFWYGTTLVLRDEYTFGKVLIVSRWRSGQSTIALFPP